MTTKTTDKAKTPAKPKADQAETDNATDTANKPADEQLPQQTDTNTNDSAEKAGDETRAPEKKEDEAPAKKPVKKPAKAKSAEKPATKGYECQWQLQHNGRTYKAGDTVQLTDKEADSLKKTGVIKGDDA